MGKLLYVLFFFMFTSCAVFGQQPNTIKGKIVDEATSTPVEYATITLFDVNKNIIGGGNSTGDGTFFIKYNS